MKIIFLYKNPSWNTFKKELIIKIYYGGNKMSKIIRWTNKPGIVLKRTYKHLFFQFYLKEVKK